MVVRIRLSRFGRRHQPFYNIVVAQARYVRVAFNQKKFKFTAIHAPSSWIQKSWNKRISLFHWFRIPVLANSSWFFSCRSARDSKPLEVIGTYNPIPQKPTNLTDEEAQTAKAYKEITLDRSRAKYWLGVGAQPSETVWRLLSMVCVALYCFFFSRESWRVAWGC